MTYPFEMDLLDIVVNTLVGLVISVHQDGLGSNQTANGH
jgi:hypothetical protein